MALLAMASCTPANPAKTRNRKRPGKVSTYRNKVLLRADGGWRALLSFFRWKLTPFFLITWTFHPSMALAMAVTMRASANMIQRRSSRKNKRKCCLFPLCRVFFSLLKSETRRRCPAGCRAPNRRTSAGACASAFPRHTSSNSRRGRLVPPVLSGDLLQRKWVVAPLGLCVVLLCLPTAAAAACCVLSECKARLLPLK